MSPSLTMVEELPSRLYRVVVELCHSVLENNLFHVNCAKMTSQGNYKSHGQAYSTVENVSQLVTDLLLSFMSK